MGFCNCSNENKATDITCNYQFFFCCISAVLQFFDIRNRALDGDLAGIMDTIDITVIGIVVMMLITIILNFVALKLRDKHN